MSYDRSGPLTISHGFGSINFATTPAAAAIRRPLGCTRARIEDIRFQCATTVVGSTSPPQILLGTAGDTDKYALMNITAGTAATDGFSTLDDTDAIFDAGKQIDMSAQGDNISQIEVTFIAAVGSAAGAGIVTVIISWYP